MPLFGHKKDHAATDNTHSTTHGTHGTHGTNPTTGNVLTNPNHPGASGGQNNYQNAPGTGTAHLSGMTPQNHTDPNHATNTSGGVHPGQQNQVPGQYAQQGTAGSTLPPAGGLNNAAAGTYGHQQGTTGSTLPPAGTLNDPDQSRGKHSLTGKVEHAVGTLVGSSALKAKGLQKEQEAASIKLQTEEITEAERLEREALLRRERAVAHGAHPDNATPAQHGHSSGATY